MSLGTGTTNTSWMGRSGTGAPGTAMEQNTGETETQGMLHLLKSPSVSGLVTVLEFTFANGPCSVLCAQQGLRPQSLHPKLQRVG